MLVTSIDSEWRAAMASAVPAMEPSDSDQLVAAMEGRATAYVAQLVEEIQEEMMVALLQQVQCCAISCANICAKNLTSLQRQMLRMVVEQAGRRCNGESESSVGRQPSEDNILLSALSPTPRAKREASKDQKDEGSPEPKAVPNIGQNVDHTSCRLSQYFATPGATSTRAVDGDALSGCYSTSSPELISEADDDTVEQGLSILLESAGTSDETDMPCKDRCRHPTTIVFDAPPTLVTDSEDIVTMMVRLRAARHSGLEAVFPERCSQSASGERATASGAADAGAAAARLGGIGRRVSGRDGGVAHCVGGPMEERGSAPRTPPGLKSIRSELPKRTAESPAWEALLGDSPDLTGVWAGPGGSRWELFAACTEAGPCFASSNGRLQLASIDGKSWSANFGYYEVPVGVEDHGQTLVFGNGQRWRFLADGGAPARP